MIARAIDVHTHIFTEEAYSTYMEKAQGRTEKIITIHYWAHKGLPKYTLEEVLDFAAAKPNMYVLAAVNVDFNIKQQRYELDRLLRDRKIVGVKMYPGYQYFYPNDERACVIAELCQAHTVPLMFHSGAMSQRGKPLLKYAHPLHIDELALRFPELKIVIAHMGFPWLIDAAAVIAKHQNVYADLSGTVDKVSPEALVRLVSRYKEELRKCIDFFPDIAPKLMFGTDYSGEHTLLTEVEPYFEVVDAVFSPKEREDVLYNTANKLFFPS